jgi:MFS family permease
MKNTSKLKERFGLNASILSMLGMVVLIGMGEKMGERFLPIYILAIGGSTYAVGALNAIDNFLSAIYSYIGGILSDRFGYKNTLMGVSLLSIFGFLIVIVFPSWQAVLIGSLFFISWTALSLPAILSLIATTLKESKQTMGVSIHSLVRRIPMALGPVLGGVIIEVYGIVLGARIAFGIALIFALVAIVFIKMFVIETSDRTPIDLKAGFTRMSKPLRILLISDILIRFAEQIPYAFVVVYVMNTLSNSPITFSVLTLIEMLTAMFIYIPVALLSERVSSKTIVSITFFFFAIFPIVLSLSNSIWMLYVAFIIRGLKEFGEPTRKALIVRLSDSDIKASAYGTYYLIRDVVVSIAALFSAVLWNVSPYLNFGLASFFGFIGLFIFIRYGSDKKVLT